MKSYLLNLKQHLKNTLYKISLQKLMVIFLILIITVCTLLIAGFSYSLSKQIIQRKTQQYTTDILSEMSNNIDMKLLEVDSITTYICYNTAIQQQILRLNTADSNSQIYEEKRILERELINLTVANDSLKETTIVTENFQTAWLEQPSLNFPPDSTIYTELEENNGALTWMTQQQESNLQIIGGRTINDLWRQKNIGYLLVRFDNELLREILTKKNFFQDGFLCVVDENGIVLSSSDPDLEGKPYKYFSLLKSGSSPQKDIESNDWITFCNIPGTNWNLASSISSISYEKEILQLRTYIITIAINLILLSAMITIGISKLIFKPLKNLCCIMTSVGQGNFKIEMPQQYKNEIGDLYNYFFNMVRDIEKLIQTTNQQQILLQKTELNSLRMQINPHFIYNTLESIKWIAYMDDNQEIVTMVKALGDFMRSSISGAEFIPIEQELENIQCYLTIQKFRYGDKLDVSLNVPPSLYHAQIPKLLLQPLIENAMIHGLEQKISKGIIIIDGQIKNDNTVIIKVIDNGIGFTQDSLIKLKATLESPNESSHRFGLGLKNVHQRIQMYYGIRYGIDIESKYGSGTTVSICIPFLKENN